MNKELLREKKIVIIALGITVFLLLGLSFWLLIEMKKIESNKKKMETESVDYSQNDDKKSNVEKNKSGEGNISKEAPTESLLMIVSGIVSVVDKDSFSMTSKFSNGEQTLKFKVGKDQNIEQIADKLTIKEGDYLTIDLGGGIPEKEIFSGEIVIEKQAISINDPSLKEKLNQE